MAFNNPHQYLIAYDIADAKRLGKVYRYLKTCAVPVQYSVFTAVLKHEQLQTLIATLEQIIHKNQDDVRIYPLPKKIDAIVIGRSLLAKDIQLIMQSKALIISEIMP